MHEGQAFRPAGSYVRESRGIQVATLDLCATMGHQIHLQKARSSLLPLLEGADGNLLLQQRSDSSRGEATLTSFTLETQHTIRCRYAHREQLPAALLHQLEMLMPLQRL